VPVPGPTPLAEHYSKVEKAAQLLPVPAGYGRKQRLKARPLLPPSLAEQHLGIVEMPQ
jgi:hypothetical protein